MRFRFYGDNRFENFVWDLTVKIVTVKSHINFQICYSHKIRFANTKIMKICNKTRIRVLNVNMGSEISYDTT